MESKDTLLAQVVEERAKLREERTALKPKLLEAERLHREAKATRTKVRKAAARYLKRVHAKAMAAMKPVQKLREEQVAILAQIAAQSKDLTTKREHLISDSAAYNTQLQDAWAMLTAGQQQLASEREQSSQELSHLFQLIDARKADAEASERLAKAEREQTNADTASLWAEVDGLERRAANARLVLKELEQARASQIAEVSVNSAMRAPVPLAVGYTTEETSASIVLQEREHELSQDRRALAKGRDDLAKLAEYLTDQRAILAEQCAELANARIGWQRAEVQTVGELERLANELTHREGLALAQEAVTHRAGASHRDRERGIWQLQMKLDRWHAALNEREMQLLYEREQTERNLAVRRGEIVDRETALDEVAQRWTTSHENERDALLQELALWIASRTAAEVATAQCENARRQLTKDAERLASVSLAVEETQRELETGANGSKLARRVQVLQKRWESRFSNFGKQLDSRMRILTGEATDTEARYLTLQQTLENVTAQQMALAATHRTIDRDRVLANRFTDDAPVILSLADARREQSDRELAQLRREAERLAMALRGADRRDDIVPLQQAEAA